MLPKARGSLPCQNCASTYTYCDLVPQLGWHSLFIQIACQLKLPTVRFTNVLSNWNVDFLYENIFIYSLKDNNCVTIKFRTYTMEQSRRCKCKTLWLIDGCFISYKNAKHRKVCIFSGKSYCKTRPWERCSKSNGMVLTNHELNIDFNGRFYILTLVLHQPIHRYVWAQNKLVMQHKP